ncbi:MAG: hypothetical protein ACKVVP_05775 [Chloroflexota bacterium]
MTAPSTELPVIKRHAPRRGAEVQPRELGLTAMLAAALVLLLCIGIILWTVSGIPNGNSVIVTIRNP